MSVLGHRQMAEFDPSGTNLVARPPAHSQEEDLARTGSFVDALSTRIECTVKATGWAFTRPGPASISGGTAG